jgi:hypothetical protein
MAHQAANRFSLAVAVREVDQKFAGVADIRSGDASRQEEDLPHASIPPRPELRLCLDAVDLDFSHQD